MYPILIIIGIVVLILLTGMKYSGPGSECSHDSDCHSGACGRASYADGSPYKCCPKGNTTIWFTDYCKGLPDGTPCGNDDMCEGYCDNKISGFGASGICKAACARCPLGYNCKSVGGGVACFNEDNKRVGNIKTNFSGCC